VELEGNGVLQELPSEEGKVEVLGAPDVGPERLPRLEDPGTG